MGHTTRSTITALSPTGRFPHRHNRLKKLVGSIRKGNAAKDQKTLSFRRTEEGAEPDVKVSQESPPSEPKKKGLFRRISKKSKE